MNIYEVLSFNFKEFVTSPSGILIIVGIVCLIIGIILSLKEGKKKTDTPLKVEENKEEEKKEESVETTAPVEDKTETPVDSPVVAPVVETTTAEPIEMPTTPAPIEMPTTPVAPVEMPTVPEVEIPTTPAPIEMPTTPVVEAPATEPVIYGGASPEVAKEEVVEEKPREIYGGANPLENTAPIPTVVVRGTYTESAPAEEVKEEAPAEAPVEEPAPAPVEEKPAEEEIEKLEF